jgi:hypothetical protein
MNKIKTKGIKAPVDIIEALQREYPNSTNVERVRRLYENHIEMKELQNKLFSVGTFLYGKKTWEKRFGKKE